MVTQTELIGISSWTKPVLHQKIIGKSFTQAMTFRRNIQIAITEYARHHASMDAVKLGALQVCGWIENWCRDGYYKHRLPLVLKENPDLILKPKKAAKALIRKEWSDMSARWNF